MTSIEVLTSQGCASCQKAKKRIDALVTEVHADHPELEWTEVNIVEHPDVARRYGVMSTPAIAIDGRLFATGVPKLDELRHAVEEALSSRQ